MGDGPFRDDREADQARIAALEAELASTKDRVAELEGRRSQALVLASSSALTRRGERSTGEKIAGAPLRLDLERKFEGAFPVDKLEDLLPIIRGVTKDRGQTELLRSSMTWSATAPRKGAGPFTTVFVSVSGGHTQLTVGDRLGPLAGAHFGGIVGGSSSGAILGGVLGGLWLGPAVAVVAPIVWLGTTFSVARALFKRGARKRAERMQQLFDAVAAEIERVLSSQPRPP